MSVRALNARPAMRWLAPTLGFALASLPSVALACPVCFDANEANRDAFLFTTVLMSLLPLALIGGTVWFLYRRTQQMAQDDA